MSERQQAQCDERLRRLLGGAETRWLLLRARDRLERGRPLTGTVTLADASAAQRRAVERLVGRPAGAGKSLSVSLEEVDRVLRASGAAPDGLATAVVVLTGEIRDLSRERADTEAAWRAAYSELDAEVAGRTDLTGWRDWIETTGIVRRLVSGPHEAPQVLDALTAVLRRLPASGLPIGRLAAEACGDAHALDEGRPVGTLALSAARALGGLPPATDGSADARRDSWAAVGVHLDELSCLVLCLGLVGDTRTPLGRMLATGREAGQPMVLTLRQLRCHGLPLPARGVFLCENPVVVATAADRIGAGCPPLVCVGGHPSAAVWALLESLADGGAEFRYHGDFDWGGVRIASAVRSRVGWRPWHYDADGYRAAVRVDGRPLTGVPAPTPWDPALAATMRHHDKRVEEELVLDILLADLAE